MKILFAAIACCTIVLCAKSGFAQSPAKIDFKRGITIVAPDSVFSINFRFRMQTRAIYSTVSVSDLSASEIEARVRRLRLRLDGFIYDPRLTYQLQLSFSRGDLDFSVQDTSSINTSPNIVRDAAITYKPDENLTFIFFWTNQITW